MRLRAAVMAGAAAWIHGFPILGVLKEVRDGKSCTLGCSLPRKPWKNNRLNSS